MLKIYKPFATASPASKSGIGGVLTPEDADGREGPIAYFSRKLISPCYFID